MELGKCMTISSLRRLILGLYVVSNRNTQDGRYGGRSQAYYQDGYSDEEGTSARMPSSSSGGGGSTNRARPLSSSIRDRRQQPYSHGQEPHRSSHKPSMCCVILFQVLPNWPVV